MLHWSINVFTYSALLCPGCVRCHRSHGLWPHGVHHFFVKISQTCKMYQQQCRMNANAMVLWAEQKLRSIKQRNPWRRKQTKQVPPWKQDSILGWTVDFELCALYLWKRHTNCKIRPPRWESPRACTQTLHRLKKYHPNYLCNQIES